MDDPYDIPLQDVRLRRGKADVQRQRRQCQRVAGINVPLRCTTELLALSFVTYAVFGSPGRHMRTDCT
jgi:hypothetical protein